MNLTSHASKRKQQRGFSYRIIEIVEQHGRRIPVPGGAEKIFFGKKESDKAISALKKMIKLVERAKNGALIVADGKVLTVYKTT